MFLIVWLLRNWWLATFGGWWGWPTGGSERHRPGRQETRCPGFQSLSRSPRRIRPPDLEVLAKESIAHLLDRLGDAQLRSTAVWKCEGYTNEEIATRLGCTCRTIERKLKLIRTIWGEEEAS